MVTDIVNSVLADNSNRRVTETKEETNEKKKKKVTSGNVTTKRTTRSKAKEKSAPETNIPKEGDKCPICGKGHIIKGKTAFGCSEWKNGCTYRLTFE